jgi:hypothetical protein
MSSSIDDDSGTGAGLRLAVVLALVGGACALALAVIPRPLLVPGASGATEGAATLAGQVVDSSGRPVAGAWIQIAPALASSAVRAVIDGRTRQLDVDPDRVARDVAVDRVGAFEVAGLPPGAYGLTVYGPEGRIPWSDAAGGTGATAAMGVVLTAARRPPLALRVAPCAGQAAGVVLDAQGRGVPGALVTVRLASLDLEWDPERSRDEGARDDQGQGDDGWRTPTATDADGGFHLAGLCEGPYVVRARGVSSGVSLRAFAGAVRPNDRVSLRLAERSITVRVQTASRADSRAFAYLLRGPGMDEPWAQAESGGPIALSVPVGDASLLVRSDDGYGAQAVPADDDATRGVPLTPWASLRGRVVTRAGPLAGAVVTASFEEDDRNGCRPGTWWPSEALRRAVSDAAVASPSSARLPAARAFPWARSSTAGPCARAGEAGPTPTE